MNLIEMHVDSIALDRKTGEPVVLLSDPESKRALPIWIGAPEARAISFAAKKITSKRPLTHDLLYSVITKFGYTIREIQITELRDRAYRALILLAKENGNGHETTMSVDARPSDAIALSVIAGARVLVSSDLVTQASFSTQTEDEVKDEQEFKEFLQTVKASDFKIDTAANNDAEPSTEQEQSDETDFSP